MNPGFRLSFILACFGLVFACLGCDGVGTTVSDVPCMRPTEWPEEILTSLVRAAEDGSDVLLVTGQTSEQLATDRDDGMREFRPHSAVYRLDPEVGSFELVNDRVWDDANGEVVLCGGSGPSSPLGAVAVAGGNRLLDTTSPTRAVAAVLSSAGFTPGFPFVRSGFGTGQHYHQLFSEIDGSPLGDPVRVGVGNTVVVGCWMTQEDYVIYWQRTGGVGSGESMLCAVPVTEDLPPLEGE